MQTGNAPFFENSCFQGWYLHRGSVTEVPEFLRKGAGTFGTGVLYKLAKLAAIAPPAVSRQLSERIKHHVQALVSACVKVSGSSIIGIQRMNHIMNSDSITARPGSYTPKVYHNGDRAIIKSENFAAEISAFSTRIANYDLVGTEPLKAWQTACGMTLLHTDGDPRQFEDNWKPTVDWYRLPGTTVVHKPLKERAFAERTTSERWVGGSNLANVGAFGMSMGPEYTDMSGRKSWLTLGGNQIICLGAGITNSDKKGPTETIVLNRKLNDAGDNTFVVANASKSTILGWSDTLSDPSYAWLEDTGGYYFPGNGSLKAKREERSGKWTSFNRNNMNDHKTYTNNFLTVWQDHGKEPDDASYEYVLLPDRTQSEVAEYANNPPFTILKNTPKVQAVVNNNQYAGNFWTSASTGIVTTNNPASVVLQIERGAGSGDYPNKLHVGISDPTQKQSTIKVEIDRDVDASSMTGGRARVEDNKDRVSVIDSNGPLVLKVDVSGSHGDTISATFGWH